MTNLLALLSLFFVCFICTDAFSLNLPSGKLGSCKLLKTREPRLFSSTGGPELDEGTREKINSVIQSNKVVLFMKGNKLFPQCGFSNTACRILDALNTPYETVNVLDDERIRNGIKMYSSWPTIPQLYVAGEFVGGSDIMIDLYQNGQLAEMIEIANAS